MDRCVICGEPVPEGRQVCPGCNQNEGTVIEQLMRAAGIVHTENTTAFEIKDEMEQAFRQGYEEGIRQLESKYWDSQRLIDQYAAERERMKFLLRELLMNQRKNCSDCNVEMLSEECKKRPDGATCFVWKYLDEVMELINE